MSLKATLKPFAPPILLDLLRRVVHRGGAVRGDFGSWRAAQARATGYDASEIFNRVLAATRKVETGEAVYERDSALFDHIEYSWPLLASLLQTALECKSLRVVDFGGALGSTWRQNRKYLQRLDVPLSWRVVEQEHFVAAGSREFTDDVLSFYDTIAEAARGGVDAVLFASSLCYVEDPRALLREAAASSARFLLIDRLPLASGGRDRIALQQVAEPIYDASYPIHLFAEDHFLERWLGEWRLIEGWDCDLQPDPDLRSRGFFMERR
jgi:putative methyltransferase (TIGR04325 family)